MLRPVFMMEEHMEEHMEEDTVCVLTSSIVECEPQRKGSSRLSTVFLVINAALGAGLLNFPKAFDQAGGVVTAIVVQAVLLAWIVAALLILAHCAGEIRATTLTDVLHTACGKPGRIACSVAIALYCFGTCITFLIVIGDQFDRVLETLVGPTFCHDWYMDRSFTICASSVLFILPFCFSKRIDFLRYMSSVGVLAVVYVVGVITWQYFAGDFIPGPIKTSPTHWTDVFLVVPVICFGYQCHVSIVPIYSCMKRQSLYDFSLVVSAALVACVAAYSVAGVLGYLTFGGKVESDVLESYDGANALILLGVAAVALKTATTYPLLLFCGREAVCDLWLHFLSRGDSSVALGEVRRRIVVASVWFALTLLIAVFSPDIGIVIDVLGSLAAVFIFIFPGLCLLQATLRYDPSLQMNKQRLLAVVSCLFLTVGTFIFGVVLVQAVERFARQSESGGLLCRRS